MNSDGRVHTHAPANARRWLALAALVGFCVSVGMVAGLLFNQGAWYEALEKPSFNPPAWTPVFFGAKSLMGGLAVIVLMAIAIVVTIQRFHPLDRIAAWLLAPYLAWVAFASSLHVSLLALKGKF